MTGANDDQMLSHLPPCSRLDRPDEIRFAVTM